MLQNELFQYFHHRLVGSHVTDLTSDAVREGHIYTQNVCTQILVTF